MYAFHTCTHADMHACMYACKDICAPHAGAGGRCPIGPIIYTDCCIYLQVRADELDDAQIEISLWEQASHPDATAGGAGHMSAVSRDSPQPHRNSPHTGGAGSACFLGEVIVNCRRLHNLAQHERARRISQDVEFECKAGWTHKAEHGITGRILLGMDYACSSCSP